MEETKYYIFIEDGKINGCGQVICEEAECIEVAKEIFEQFEKTPECFDLVDGEPVLNIEKLNNSNYELEEIKNQFIIAVQDVLDIEAHKLGYDDIKSVCTYATSSIPKFRAEAEAFVLWRDSVWTYCYAELDKVTSGESEIPDLDDFLESLPKLSIEY